MNVDAIIFWFVHDAQKAALNITNYREAIDRVAQTSLREMIGMNIIYEATKERGTTILMPTSMVDSMNPVVALALAGQDKTAPANATGSLPLGNRSTQQKSASKVGEPSRAFQST